jgi:hypothetical protein
MNQKTLGKIFFWISMGFLAAAVVFLCCLIGGYSLVLTICGLVSVLITVICLLISGVSFLKYDDKANVAESKEDAPKAH